METFWWIVFCIGVFLIVFGVWMGERNNKVYVFRMHVLDLCGSAAKRCGDDWCKPYRISHKHSYYRMLFSFKPLKLEAWFTDDEIKVLKNGNDD